MGIHQRLSECNRKTWVGVKSESVAGQILKGWAQSADKKKRAIQLIVRGDRNEIPLHYLQELPSWGERLAIEPESRDRNSGPIWIMGKGRKIPQ